MKVLERDVEAYAVSQSKKLGVVTLKLTSPANRGVPDRIFVYGGRTVFVELKAPGNVPTKQQQFWLRKLAAAGADTLVLDSKEAVARFLEGLTAS